MVFFRKQLYLSSVVCLVLAQLVYATENQLNTNHLSKRQINPDNDIVVPTNSEWMKIIDFSNVKGEVRPVTSGICEAPKCDGSDNNDCYQSCGCLPIESDHFGCTIPDTWALTFDDGPSDFTPLLLDILEKKNVKATFCIIGSHAEKYPEILKRIHEEGHMLASHTYSHAHLMSLTNEEIVNELRATDEVIYRITGVSPRYVRPPFGEADLRVKALIKEMGYRVLMWNVDPHDYNVHMKPDGGLLIQSGFEDVLDGKPNFFNVFGDPGYISLQHDLYRPSIIQVEEIIDLIRSRGYNITTVNQCVGDADMHNITPAIDRSQRNFKSSSIDLQQQQPKEQKNIENNNAGETDTKVESEAEANMVAAEMNVDKSSEESNISGANKLVAAAISLATIPLGFIQFLF